MSRWQTEIDELFQQAEQNAEEQRRSCPDCGTPVVSVPSSLTLQDDGIVESLTPGPGQCKRCGARPSSMVPCDPVTGEPERQVTLIVRADMDKWHERFGDPVRRWLLDHGWVPPR